MIALLLVAAGILAAASDYTSCRWLRARDEGQAGTAVLLSMVLETLTWLPIVMAIELSDYRFAIACILGSGLGAYLGLRKRKKG